MIESINPYNGKVVYTTEKMSTTEVDDSIKKTNQAFLKWKHTSFEQRTNLFLDLAEVLIDNKDEWAKVITLEMGKPIKQSIAEIEKCAWLCEYYAHNAEDFLSDRTVKTDAKQSYIRYDPLGVVLGVMPWNFPFWQAFRFAIPTIMAGNTIVLKHASNVMKSATIIEKAFISAGFSKHIYTNLPIDSKEVEEVIRNPLVKAVSLTGSKPAGSAVASVASEEIKPSLLELGGSNALVVFEDCDIDKTIEICMNARFQNTGQSCIAGKRLLIQNSIKDTFLSKLKVEVEALKSGNPMDEDTYIGVLARTDLAEDLKKQLEDSVKLGAEILTGGKTNNAYFEPTIVTNCTMDMPVAKEETFGPLLACLSFDTEEEAVEIVNASEFGLGVSIFTQKESRIKDLVPKFDDGAIFVNALVKSDPRLPFGGTKISGYGRELSQEGIRQFVNIKTVYIQ